MRSEAGSHAKQRELRVSILDFQRLISSIRSLAGSDGIHFRVSSDRSPVAAAKPPAQPNQTIGNIIMSPRAFNAKLRTSICMLME
ncbi:hypothetical protein SAMD00023353_5200730 [Rosellinia necatrix]|uniref:Uncharacterized protein n=1 Tax=Rosellinia necatrix TaxID=77044 RepID=A0A1S8A9S1_ROSNE|nr:hypothetical protein SAMD00023353_5200730 [Rosellinia necatrix]